MVQQTRHKQWFSIQMWDILSLFLVMQWSHDMLRFWRLFYRPFCSPNTASEVFFPPNSALVQNSSHCEPVPLPQDGTAISVAAWNPNEEKWGEPGWSDSLAPLVPFANVYTWWITLVRRRAIFQAWPSLWFTNEKKLKNLKLGGSSRTSPKGSLKFFIWNQTAGFVSLLTVSSCWPRRVGAGPDFIFRYSARLLWLEFRNICRWNVWCTHTKLCWLICRIIKTNPLDLWRFRSMNYRQIFMFIFGNCNFQSGPFKLLLFQKVGSYFQCMV